MGLEPQPFAHSAERPTFESLWRQKRPAIIIEKRGGFIMDSCFIYANRTPDGALER